MPGWQSGVLGWSLGEKGSGAPIELNESLRHCHVGVFTYTFQVLLWGVGKELPEVWLFPQARPDTRLVPFNPQQWLQLDREELKRVSMGGDIRLRFDQSPVRFGNYILESLQPLESNKETCSFCDQPLHTYFRVGSQQACPSCAEKFRMEMKANIARNYRRALVVGILSAIAGGGIHSLLVAGASLSIGSILIGVLVGMAMRMASKESAGLRHRVTATALTLLAGFLPLSNWSDSMFLPVIFLAMGAFASWTVAARNVRTEIHGPYQAQTSN